MKRILSLVLILILLSITFVGCNNDNATTESSSVFGDKTAEQIYNDAKAALKSMDNYELYVTQIYETDFTGDPVRSESTVEYKRSGNTAYAKTLNSSVETEERWFVDGVMYFSNSKEKINISLDAFLTNYFADISSILIDLKPEDFSDKKIEEANGVYTLSIVLSPEKYEEYVGSSIGENATYNISFDSEGVLCSVEMNTSVAASNNAWITMITKFDFKNVGSTEPINAPADIN